MPAEAPTAPPAAPAAQQPSPTQPPGGRITDLPTPAHPPTTGSRMDQLMADLDKRFGLANDEDETTPNVPRGTKTEDKPEAPLAKDEPAPKDADDKPSEDPEQPEPPKEGSEPPKEGEPKKQKVNPWRLVDEYKTKVAKLEEDLAKAKTGESPLAEQEKKELTDRYDKTASRLKELEDEIRFVNYEKSTEFQEKYQAPYEKAWQRAIGELAEIPVTDSTGNSRPAAVQDLLELVQLPLGKARSLAKEAFGDFADDVMAHRKEIKNLFDQRQQALKEAREQGAEREKSQAELKQRELAEASDFAKRTWEAAQREELEHPEYGEFFKAPEGNAEMAALLEKGFKEVDEAMSKNAVDLSLKPEERAMILRKQAALRHRAAAFNRMVKDIKSRDQRITELERELELYKTTTPPAGGSTPAAAGTEHGSKMDRLMSDLDNWAASRRAR